MSILYTRHTVVAGYYGFMLSVCLSVHLSVVHPGRCQVHSEVSISVEFHIMRFMSVYSIIVGLNLHCGVKRIGVVGLKGSKQDQRDNLTMSIL